MKADVDGIKGDEENSEPQRTSESPSEGKKVSIELSLLQQQTSGIIRCDQKSVVDKETQYEHSDFEGVDQSEITAKKSMRSSTKSISNEGKKSRSKTTGDLQKSVMINKARKTVAEQKRHTFAMSGYDENL